MAELNYTPLRHRMLAEFDAGHMVYMPGWRIGNSGWWARKGDEFAGLPAGETRAVNEFSAAGLVTFENTYSPAARPAFPTRAGRHVLAVWDAKHGPINIEET